MNVTPFNDTINFLMSVSHIEELINGVDNLHLHVVR